MSHLGLISPKTHQVKISQSPWWPRVLQQFAEKASEETSKKPTYFLSQSVKQLVSVRFLHLLSKPSQCWLCFPLWLRSFVFSQWFYCKNTSFVLQGAVYVFNEVTLDKLWIYQTLVLLIFLHLISHSLFWSHVLFTHRFYLPFSLWLAAM